MSLIYIFNLIIHYCIADSSDQYSSANNFPFIIQNIKLY